MKTLTGVARMAQAALALARTYGGMAKRRQKAKMRGGGALSSGMA